MEALFIVLALVLLITPFVALVMVVNLQSRVRLLERQVRVLIETSSITHHKPTPIVEQRVEEASLERQIKTPPLEEPTPPAPLLPPVETASPIANDEDETLAKDLRERYAALVAQGAVPPLQSEREDAQIDEIADRLAVLPAANAPSPTPMPAPTVTQTEPEKPSFVFSFEDLFGRRLPIWAGGITLAIAGVLIVKYAIDAGLLTPWIRIMSGLLFGGALIAGAEYAYRKEDWVKDPRVCQALSGAGIATLYASVLMAHNVYGMIGPVGAFVAMAAITAAALGLSLRFGAPSALLGLAGGLATPALIGSMQPNVPLLAAYLALTVGGLTAVSRRQKWMWLGVAALAGGGIWSFILIVTDALAPANAVAVALLVLAIAIVLPLFGFSGPRQAIFRMIAAIIGASQIAVLVALGGFTPLHWGLFILIAAACQWLVWRERRNPSGEALFALLPFASLILSIMLLLAWPNPTNAELAIVSGILLLLHAVPLYPRIWSDDKDYPAVQWMVIGVSAFLITMRHLVDLQTFARNLPVGLILLAGAVFTLAPVATGWAKVHAIAANAPRDTRLPLLLLVSAIIASVASYFLFPAWTIPICVGIIALAILELVRRAGNPVSALPVPAIAAIAAFGLLAITPSGWDEFSALSGLLEEANMQSAFRWGIMAFFFTLFAFRASPAYQQYGSGAGAALLAYGAVAQFISPTWLPLVAPTGLLALTIISTRRTEAPHRAIPAAQLTLVAIALAWAAETIIIWYDPAMTSLFGINLDIENIPTITESLTHLAIPALLAGISLWLTRPQYASQIEANPRVKHVLLAISGLLIAACGIALHILYRHGFANMMGDDFIATGMMQRAIWAAILLCLGWLLIRRGGRLLPDGAPLWIAPAVGTAYLSYYSYLLHNPLWSEQAVGAWPLANMLLSTFALVMGGLWLTEKETSNLTPPKAALATRIIDGLRAFAVILFAYQTLAQAFHGSMLYPTSVSEAENILRSILAIALAIGFLLWGIRTKKRDWRIASLVLMILAVTKVFLLDASGLTGLIRIGSFVALGFSLIGIGWLYSRQLRNEPSSEPAAEKGS